MCESSFCSDGTCTWTRFLYRPLSARRATDQGLVDRPGNDGGSLRRKGEIGKRVCGTTESVSKVGSCGRGDDVGVPNTGVG